MASDADRLIAQLIQRLTPVRVLRRRDGVALVLAAVAFTTVTAVMVFGPRADVRAGAPDAMFLLSSGLFLVLGVAASYTVIEMGRPRVGNRHDGWIWAAAMAALLPAAALLIAALEWLRTATFEVDDEGVRCLLGGTLLGVLLAVALVLWLRRGAPSSPERAGMLTGLAAGSVGIFGFGLHCPHNDIMHIGLWHGLVVVLAAAVGRLLVPRLVRW